jgi:membrane-bound lytic murein transglycosylase B
MPWLVAIGIAALAVPPLHAAPKKPRTSTPAPARTDYSKRADVREFIAEMAQKHGFVEAELSFLFSRARFYPAIVELITPPANPRVRSWQAYRSRFLDPVRIDGGVALWHKYAKELARAEKEYGVPAEIIVAIMGVETVYGRNTGNWRVIDALSTLAFDYPKRAEFFRSELENYLLFAREHDVDVFSVRGSYAGAIGIPQFMPGSWRRYAVDYDGNGKINLRESFIDSIGSIGNFLRGHGWAAGGAIAFPAQVEGAAWQALLEKDILPHTRIGDLEKYGIASKTLVSQGFPADTLFALVDLATPDAPTEYWVGLQNFYVITRYNRSSFYAMSVMQLAEAIRKAR